MVKKIITIADIHIRNVRRHEEYTEYFIKFLNNVKELVKDYDKDEVRILVLGDLVHQKIQISNELNLLLSWFLRKLNNIAKTIVIAGNHDLLVNNKDRIDTLTPIFSIANFDNTYYADKELDYHSGCIVDDNIIWALYSIFDDYQKPNIDVIREHNPKCDTVIGLFHGDVVGAVMDSGEVTDSGISGDRFEGCDFVCAGHIHKRQELKRKGVSIVFTGSFIQQDFGENVTEHGFTVWDVESRTYEHHNIEGEYGFYKFQIKDINDVDEDIERLINL